MKNKSLIGVIIAFVLGVAGFGGYQTFGNISGDNFNVYGTSANTTAVTSTSKTLTIDSSKSLLNLNIKTSSTAAQTISVYTEYSNDVNCDTTEEWFRDTRNAGVVGFTTDPNTFTVATSTFSLGIGAGVNRNTIQIGGNDVGGALNARCVKVNLSTSSTTDPAILWTEAYFSN